VLQFCHGKEWKEILMSAKRVIKAGLPDHVVHISTTTTTTMFNVVLTLSYGFDASRRNAQQNMRERNPGWRGTPILGIFGGGVPPASPNPDQTTAISHTRFQTWPQKSIPVFRPDLVHD